MAVITLTTDWRNSDYYIGAVKGKIISHDSSVNIIDISHQIVPFNVMQAAFVVRSCYSEFPQGTVHIIAVNTVLTAKRTLLIIECEKQYFICSDSGFPGLMFPFVEKKVYRMIMPENAISTFASLDKYVDVAVNLVQGAKIIDMAVECSDYIEQMPLLPTIDSNLISGSVIFIDSYQNAITNINKETFERVGKGSAFQIFVQSNHYMIDKISKTYSNVPTGELLAVFNSIGLLEIALANGPVAELLDLKISSVIRIKFNPDKKENKLLLSGE
jgi:S-adenosylmethionine hydrolase